MNRKLLRPTLFMTAALVALHAHACASDDDAGFDSAGADGGSNGSGDAGEGGSGPILDGGRGGDGASGGTDGGAAGQSGEGGNGAEAGIVTGPVDAGFPDVSFPYDPIDAGTETCATVMGEATEISRPVDIIVSIDNSGSMSEEIEAVQLRVNTDFANILEASNIDYRVIVVSRYGWVEESIGGSNFPICIGPPLGAASCLNAGYPMLQLNPPRYYHHSTDIESRNMWCRLLTSFDSADEVEDGGGQARDAGDPHFPWVPLAPSGWQEWLREGSFKIFVGITDDAPGGDGCGAYANSASGAANWDRALRQRAPEHFGAYDQADPDANRNYVWYSIIGMVQNNPPTTPWPPTEPYQAGTCPDTGGGAGVRDGLGYQELSILTGGLRYPSCLNNDFDAVFNAIAQGVIDRSELPCEFEIPDVEGIINPDAIQVSYQPGDGGAAQPFGRVALAGDCSGTSVYFDDNDDPTRVLLCPAACDTVRADAEAKISLDFGCLGS